MEWRSRGGATTRWSTAHSTGSALARGLLSHAQPRVSSSGPSAHGSSTVAHLWAGGAGSSGSSLGLYPPLPRRARGATGPRPRLPAPKAASYPSGARGCEGWGRRSLGASRAVGEGSAVRRGARVPARLSTRCPAGPPTAPPPRRRRSRAWADRTPSRAAASTRAPARDARPAARGRRSIWLG